MSSSKIIRLRVCMNESKGDDDDENDSVGIEIIDENEDGINTDEPILPKGAFVDDDNNDNDNDETTKKKKDDDENPADEIDKPYEILDKKDDTHKGINSTKKSATRNQLDPLAELLWIGLVSRYERVVIQTLEQLIECFIVVAVEDRDVYRSKQNKLKDSGGYTCLVVAMKKWYDSIEIQSLAIQVLYRALLGMPFVIHNLAVQVGVLDGIVYAMTRYATNEEIQLNGCATLLSLVMHKKMNNTNESNTVISQFVHNNRNQTIAVLVTTMNNYPTNIAIQLCCCWIFQQLSDVYNFIPIAHKFQLEPLLLNALLIAEERYNLNENYWKKSKHSKDNNNDTDDTDYENSVLIKKEQYELRMVKKKARYVLNRIRQQSSPPAVVIKKKK